jgi:hypothetical protein
MARRKPMFGNNNVLLMKSIKVKIQLIVIDDRKIGELKERKIKTREI